MNWQRSTIAFVALVAALAPRITMAQSEFVGTIHYDVINKGRHITLVLATDGLRVREDLIPTDSIAGAYPFSTIVDAAKGELTVLMPVTHRYRVIHFTTAHSSSTQRGMEGLTATRRHERILGVDCELFLNRGDEYCVTTALGRVSPLDSLIAHSDSLSAASPVARMVTGGGLALRMRWNSADPPLTMTASTIDRDRPPASVFAVPRDYERIP